MTAEAGILDIGYHADQVDNNNGADGNQNREARSNHQIAPIEDAAFRDFMQSMQN